MRFAIVGFGAIGPVHLEALNNVADAEPVVAIDTDAGRREAAAERYGIATAASLDKALASHSFDAVAVCTPPGSHAEVALAAARAGKHVVIEKPIAATLEDADRLIEVCASHDAQIAVVHQRRFDPVFERVRALVDAGSFGRVVLAGAFVPLWRSREYFAEVPWRGEWAATGGGALTSQAIHWVDLLLALLGDVVRVTGHAATLHHAVDVEDTVAAVLEFRSGALGTILAGTAVYAGDATSESMYPSLPERLEIYGTEGSVVLVDGTPATWVFADGTSRPPAPDFEVQARFVGPRYVSEYAEMYRNIVKAFRAGRPPRVDGVEARRTFAVVNAVYESSRTGCPVEV